LLSATPYHQLGSLERVAHCHGPKQKGIGKNIFPMYDGAYYFERLVLSKFFHE